VEDSGLIMDKSLIDQAANALSIQGVYLRDASIRAGEDLGPQPGAAELSLTPQYRSGPIGRFCISSADDDAVAEAPRIVIFYFETGIRLVDSELVKDEDGSADIPDKSIHLEITATFAAHYLLRADADVDQILSALEEFAGCNVGYHVWPYWREYVQSTCARLGIPPVPVPLYRVPAAEVEEGNPEE
jgi:hypothetical protein